MATEFCKWYSYWLFPVGVETSCVAFQSLGLLSLVIGLMMMVLQSLWSWWAHSVAAYVCVQCPCQWCTIKKFKKNTNRNQPILWMARSILCYDSVLKVGAFKSHRRLETVHSRALFFHFQVLLSVQTKAKGSRQTGLADWCLGGGRGGVILQLH